MKENSDLRKDMTMYRLEVEKVKSQLIKAGGGGGILGSKPKSVITTSSVSNVNNENVDSNIMPEKAEKGEEVGVKRSFQSVSTDPARTDGDSNSTARKSRKAKPLVTSTGEDNEGGECAQS